MADLKEINNFLDKRIKRCEEMLTDKNSAFYSSEQYNLKMLKSIKDLLNNKKPSS